MKLWLARACSLLPGASPSLSPVSLPAVVLAAGLQLRFPHPSGLTSGRDQLLALPLAACLPSSTSFCCRPLASVQRSSLHQHLRRPAPTLPSLRPGPGPVARRTEPEPSPEPEESAASPDLSPARSHSARAARPTNLQPRPEAPTRSARRRSRYSPGPAREP